MKVDDPAIHLSNLKSTFARTMGWGLCRLSGDDALKLANQTVDIMEEHHLTQLHVWQRDSNIPGDHGFEPFTSVLAQEVASLIEQERVRRNLKPATVNQPAKTGSQVLDVAIVEPSQWWLGKHRVETIPQRWPGGVPSSIERQDVISRAYYKLAEAVIWSQMKIRPRDVCTELGSAPGGAVQFLTEMGAQVIAVDPAELDESLQGHPQVSHLRMRTKQIPKKEIATTRWLFADLNVAPDYTISAIQDIVTNRATKVQGIIATLKISDWKLIGQLDAYRQRFKDFGFKHVLSRQLAFGRQEICVAAFRDQFTQRAPKASLKQKALGTQPND
jgi:23S rRNA (cytidine2498-2'-O)-methyltransferase